MNIKYVTSSSFEEKKQRSFAEKQLTVDYVAIILYMWWLAMLCGICNWVSNEIRDNSIMECIRAHRGSSLCSHSDRPSLPSSHLMIRSLLDVVSVWITEFGFLDVITLNNSAFCKIFLCAYIHVYNQFSRLQTVYFLRYVSYISELCCVSYISGKIKSEQ